MVYLDTIVTTPPIAITLQPSWKIMLFLEFPPPKTSQEHIQG